MKHRWHILVVFTLFFYAVQAQEKIRVACIGNSVTEALSLPVGKDYPSVLQHYLGDRYTVRNFGVSGSTLLFDGHKPYVKSEKYRQSLAFKPDIVIISLGLNDTDPRNWPNFGDRFVADYNALIDSYLQEAQAKQVYVCINTPIFSGHTRFLSGTRDWYDAIQERIRMISQTRNLPLIDLRQSLHDRIDLFDDFLHPNEEGTQIIAKTVFDHLVAPKYTLSVDAIYGSGMVLQRDREVRLSGKGKAFSTVSLWFDKNRLQGKVDSSGRWRVAIPKQKAGGPYRFQIQSGEEGIRIDSVYFGDIYFTSGQSNMAFELKYDTAQFHKLKQKVWPGHIRYFKNQSLAETNKVSWDTTMLARTSKLDFFDGKWTNLNIPDVANYSAIAIAFLDDLSTRLSDVPLAVIEMAVGGSNTESWIDRRTLELHPLTAGYIHNWLSSDFIQDFCRTRAALNLKNSKVKNSRHPYQPAYNFEAGVSKWRDFKVKGILWYQGESNAHNIELHEMLFPLLLDSWRKAWADPQLPFYYVQLSGINRPSWPEFRNSQRLLEDRVEQAWMVPSYDVGDSLNVHPTDKYPVGLRLSQAVRATLSGETRSLLPPRLKSFSKEKDGFVLNFDHVVAFQVSGDTDTPTGFELIDKFGRVRQDIRTELRRNVIHIYVDDTISSCIQLRYAYQPYTRANIYNENLIPIPTFKIDL